MEIADEGAEKFIAVSFRAGKKFSKAVFHNTLGKIAKLLKKGVHNKATTGKQSMKRLSRKELALQGVEVSPEEYADFHQYAKKYKIDFSMTRQKNDPSMYTMFFPQRDIEKMQAAVNDYMKDTTVKHFGLDEKLEKAKQEAFRVNEARRKEREKSRGKEQPKKEKREKPSRE